MMCGITGFITNNHITSNEAKNTIKMMTESLTHRGPDSSGTWANSDYKVNLGHRRLSIIDLSTHGHQPMVSKCGRYIIVFNGEVYNYLFLQNELSKNHGHTFTGNSDTEVILAAITEWGVIDAVKKFNGMFAIALWDNKLKKLFLIRDRIGIKPLYFALSRDNKSLIFGSELKSIRVHHDHNDTIDLNSLALYFRHNYVPTPYSIYKNTWKLSPGSILEIPINSICSYSNLADFRITQYWNLQKFWFNNKSTSSIDELENLLSDSIKLRMRSDVPIGAFLSGGIDSSTVVALMQKQSMNKIKTFSIGFLEKNYNEAHYASKVAKVLGTDHRELYLESQHIFDVIPKLSQIWDEPFSDSSQIPTKVLSDMTRNSVTVSLSGDGGDELFTGYDRYFIADKVWSLLNWVPWPLKKFGKKGVDLFGKHLTNSSSEWGKKVYQRSELLVSPDFISFYRNLISQHRHPGDIVRGGKEYLSFFSNIPENIIGSELYSKMTYLDIKTYLPDDILTKVDRASMSTGLEARVPLLDHRIVEMAGGMHQSLKLKHKQGKYPLRQILSKYVDPSLFERKKMGFGIPLGDWLRKELRSWAEDLLDPKTIKSDGIIEYSEVARFWKNHLSGKFDNSYMLWTILMFRSWQRNQS